MSPKTFSLEERARLRVAMLEAGVPLLKEYGMTHMSVERITAAAGVGKSTFYNFFLSKEFYVYEVICHERLQFQDSIRSLLNGRDKMTAAEGREVLKKIIFGQNSAYQYLTAEDEAKLYAAIPDIRKVDLNREIQIMRGMFALMEGVRREPDYPVIANLLKMMAMAAEGRAALHQEAYVRTQEQVYRLLFGLVFEEDGG